MNTDLTAAQIRQRETLRQHFGEAVIMALADPLTTDVVLNCDGGLWQNKLGGSWKKIGTLSAVQADQAIRVLADTLGTVVTPDRPWLTGVFPLDGSRIEANLPPVVRQATFALRKRAVRIYTLDDYVNASILAPAHREAVVHAVASHANILIAGGTGAGKTTFANAILAEIVRQFPHERLCIIEDTAELQCAAEDHFSFLTTEVFSMTQAVRCAMRYKPDRVVLGESRGPEALDICLAANSGHRGGLSTLHANSAASALDKFGLYVSSHPNAPRAIERLVAQSIDVVIHMTGETPTEGRSVREVLRLDGWDGSQYRLSDCSTTT
jgi:type IV secretion system protein VirB11